MTRVHLTEQCKEPCVGHLTLFSHCELAKNIYGLKVESSEERPFCELYMKDFCFRVEETQVNQLHASTGRGALIDIHLRRTKAIRNDDVLFS